MLKWGFLLKIKDMFILPIFILIVIVIGFFGKTKKHFGNDHPLNIFFKNKNDK